MTAHDALSAVIAVSALHAADQLDIRNLFDEMALITELESEIAADVEVNHPQLAQRTACLDRRRNRQSVALGETACDLTAPRRLPVGGNQPQPPPQQGHPRRRRY